MIEILSSHFDFGFLIFYGPPYLIKCLNILRLSTKRDPVARSQNDTLRCENTYLVKIPK